MNTSFQIENQNILDKLQHSFEKKIGSPADFISHAPGRINLIGEHTDYNGGLVLPAAINKYCFIAFRKRNDQKCRIIVLDLEEEEYNFQLNEINKEDKVWINYLLGILVGFQKSNLTLVGFEAVITSNIPMGAGMSSSSAYEMSFAKGINQLLGHPLTEWELIEISKNSNHEFVGIKGGIMDQFASLFGKQDQALLLDCATFKFQSISTQFQDHQWVLFNSQVKHEHSSSGYNERSQECKLALSLLQIINPTIKSLSESNFSDLDHEVFQDQMHLQDRVKFVLSENARVLDFIKALQAKNLTQLGSLLYQSHQGLQNQFKVSCKELDFLIAKSKSTPGVIGARMMGGGFGGCTINLIEKSSIHSAINEIETAYQKEFNIKMDYFLVKLVDGAGISIH